MSIRTISILYICCMAGSACSSGSSGAPASPPPPPGSPPPPPMDQAIGGFWLGVLTFDISQTSELFVALTTEDGRFRFISGESDTQFIGTQVIDMTHTVGTGLGYSDPITPWLDMTAVSATTTDAQLLEKDSFTGIWTTASGESGNFDFFYDSTYQNPSSLAILEGVWTAYDDFGNPEATFSIDGLGQFSGQNTSGCASVGQISLIDERYNVYEVTSSISNCFIAGDYGGMAAVGEINVPGDAILLSISNNDRSITLGLEK